MSTRSAQAFQAAPTRSWHQPACASPTESASPPSASLSRLYSRIVSKSPKRGSSSNPAVCCTRLLSTSEATTSRTSEGDRGTGGHGDRQLLSSCPPVPLSPCPPAQTASAASNVQPPANTERRRKA